MEPMTQEHMRFISDLVVVLVLVSPFVTFIVRLTWEMTGWIVVLCEKLADWLSDLIVDWVLKPLKRFLRWL